MFSTTKKASLAAFSLCLTLAISLVAPSAPAQAVPQPRREQLLNGLRILLLERPGDGKVLLKLRINSGSAFDLAGKSGTMALLGDALFPDPTTREYFTEELDGRIEVVTDYDAINIILTGRASEFERMIEILRTALVSTQLTPEIVTRLREERIKLVRDLSATPTAIADRAIAARLFGDFPYGRPGAGTPETLARIDRGDLVFARERFLNPNNATLAVIGGVEASRALRALRQLLGTWRKSDRVVPSTFRQPVSPDARTLILDLPSTETTEVRLATRALARSDRDVAAAALLELIARERWLMAMPELNKSAFFVRHEAHVLPGMFVMGASVRNALAAQTLATAQGVVRSLFDKQPAAAEIERARSELLATLNAAISKQTEQPAIIADAWLNMDTYSLKSMTDQVQAINGVTPADVQRVAVRLFRDAPTATVAVGNAAQLKAEFERTGKVEVLGATAITTPTPATNLKP